MKFKFTFKRQSLFFFMFIQTLLILYSAGWILEKEIYINPIAEILMSLYGISSLLVLLFIFIED